MISVGVSLVIICLNMIACYHVVLCHLTISLTLLTNTARRKTEAIGGAR